MPDEKQLTARERKFVEEYCVCLSAAKAARDAGYSKATARQQGYRLLTNVYIQKAIEAYLTEEAMGRREVLHRLAQQARGNLEPFVVISEDLAVIDLSTEEAQSNIGLLKKIETDVTVRTIAEHVVDRSVKTKIELHDPQAALVHLGRAHKLFTDRTEHSGELNVGVVRVPSKANPDEWKQQAQSQKE